MSAQPLRPLEMPLRGRQLIEASAGTGKTWTLTALYLRLVLGHREGTLASTEPPSPRPDPRQGLLPPRILVMTFTEAATSELRERIRKRLQEARDAFECWALGTQPTPELSKDLLLQGLREAFEPAQWTACVAQLDLSLQWMDEAAIHTLHGWSFRMLKQHALECRHPFEQAHLEQADLLQQRLVQDYWRSAYYALPSHWLRHLGTAVGKSPPELLRKLQKRWREEDRSPTPNAIDHDAASAGSSANPPSEIFGAHDQWTDELDRRAHAARTAWDPGLSERLLQAQANHQIAGLGITRPNFVKWVNALTAWAQGDDTQKVETLARLTRSALARHQIDADTWSPFFGRLEEWIELRQQEPDTSQRLLAHASDTVRGLYAAAKREQGVFDFADLLQQLYHGVMAPDGRLAMALREQFPVALVDEFQDTDPWQYGTLDRLHDPQQVSPDHALIMIGDPKQAIYRFRGADLATYLRAREHTLQARQDSLHTLIENRRSTPLLVHAVNHVFASLSDPFASGSGALDFVEVRPCGEDPPLPTQPLQPMTVWHLPAPEGKSTWKVDEARQEMARRFAQQMAKLLNTPSLSDLGPGDMAVLVRHQQEARAMREALSDSGLPSVYLSDQTSVYATDEALDLWRLLRAVASPRQGAWVRSAVGSRLWGLSPSALAELIQDETRWEHLLDSFHQWQQTWRERGVLPMIHQWLHSQQVAHRLWQAPMAERRLSHLLHLGELLQHASQRLHGELALVHYLAQRLDEPGHEAESVRTRLETDAQCVQVITYHKSKGLEFPLVFTPFLGSFKVERPTATKTTTGNETRTQETTDVGAAESDAEDKASASLQEDIRLLYVAFTRARRGLWLGVSEIRDDLQGQADQDTLRRSALSHLLQRQTRGDLWERLHLQWGPCSAIRVESLPPDQATRYRPPTIATTHRPARVPQRQHLSRWWTASFSSLTRGIDTHSADEEAWADASTDHPMSNMPEQALSLARPASLENQTTSSLGWQSFPAGAQYGTMLHDALEWQAQHRWVGEEHLDWQDWLLRKFRWLRLSEEARQLVSPWIVRLLNAELPMSTPNAPDQPPLTLSSLAPEAYWAEMSFSFPVHGLDSTWLEHQLQRHVFPEAERPTLQARRLQGMLTGFMDLVVHHAGRYWIVDYKSNWLPDYEAQTLQDAVLHHRYEVQYVLYTLALHRLLKLRLPDYDYERDVGGAVYLFLRGIDTPGSGVHLHRPAWALIDALDQALQQELPA